MDDVSLVVALVALAVGYALGIAIEFFVASVYFKNQARTIKRLKLELEEAKLKEEAVEVIEIIDNRKQPENYFIKF